MDVRRHFEPWDPAVAAPTAGALIAVGAVVTAVVAVVEPPRGGALGRAVALAAPLLVMVVAWFLLRPGSRRSSPLLTLVPLVALLAITALDMARHQDAIGSRWTTSVWASPRSPRCG